MRCTIYSCASLHDLSKLMLACAEAFTCIRRSAAHTPNSPRHCSAKHGDKVMAVNFRSVDVALFGFARETKYYAEAAFRRLFVSQAASRW